MNFTWFMLTMAIVELFAVIIILKKMKSRQFGRGKRFMVFFAYLVVSFVPVLSIYTDSSYAYLGEWKQYKNNALFLNSGNPNYVNIYYLGVGHMGICDFSLASPLLSTILGGVYPEVPAVEQLTRLNADISIRLVLL